MAVATSGIPLAAHSASLAEPPNSDDNKQGATCEYYNHGRGLSYCAAMSVTVSNTQVGVCS